MLSILEDKNRALPLFQEMAYNLMPSAAAAGIAPGIFYADNPDSPETAFYWDGTASLYLAGKSDNGQCNRELAQLLAEKIFPEAKAAGMSGCIWHYSAEAWEQTITEDLCPGKSLTRYGRIIYTLRLPANQPAIGLPEGFTLEVVDAAFLQRMNLVNFESLGDWLRECWPSSAAYLEHSFGFCLMHENTIVSWCMGEYVYGGRCGIGIETAKEYRKRGLATYTTAAFAAHCFQHGLTPYWDCWAGNLASVAVAEKIGYSEKIEYPVFWLQL